MSSKDTDPWSPILRVRHALVGDKDGLLEVWHDRRGYFDGIPSALDHHSWALANIARRYFPNRLPIVHQVHASDTISSSGQTSGVIDR